MERDILMGGAKRTRVSGAELDGCRFMYPGPYGRAECFGAELSAFNHYLALLCIISPIQCTDLVVKLITILPNELHQKHNGKYGRTR